MVADTFLILLGAGLLIAGIILQATWILTLNQIPHSQLVLKNNITILPQKTVESNIVNLSNLDDPLVLAIKSNSSEAVIEQKVMDKTGRTINATTFTHELLTHFVPNRTGGYSLALSNLNDKPVKISYLFGLIPKISSLTGDDLQSFNFQNNIRGMTLIIAGTIVLIAGMGLRWGIMIERGR